MATLLVDVLYNYRDKAPYRLHDFVIMPDHLHCLLTLGQGVTVERAVQLIKGGFSFRAARELEFRGEIWQRGFSEVRIRTDEEYRTRSAYICDNPIRARLVARAEDWEYSSASSAFAIDADPFAGLKPQTIKLRLSARLKSCPDTCPKTGVVP